MTASERQQAEPLEAPERVAWTFGGLYFSRYTVFVFLLAFVTCTAVCVLWLPAEMPLWRRAAVGMLGGAFSGICTQAWRMLGSGEET